MEQNKELGTAKTLGIISLISAFIFSPVAVACGHISLRKYKKLGVTDGRGPAKTGLVIGYIGLIIVSTFLIVGYISTLIYSTDDVKEMLIKAQQAKEAQQAE